eukprot:15461670-Alexandrium_andersonii.AAC.1
MQARKAVADAHPCSSSLEVAPPTQRWLGCSAARKCKMALGARRLNFVAPETTSRLVPGALEACALRCFAR